MLTKFLRSQSNTTTLSETPPLSTDSIGDKKSIAGLLIGLNAGMIFLLVLVAALFISLRRRRSSVQAAQSPASSEIQLMNMDSTASPDAYSRTNNYSAFPVMPKPVEIANTGRLTTVGRAENQYYPGIPQVLIPGGGPTMPESTTHWKGVLPEENQGGWTRGQNYSN